MTRNTRSKPFSEINVTPFVDVMLVLLIIFMVTAPMTNPGVVELPKVGETLKQQVNPIVISIKKNGKIEIDGKTFKNDALLAHVKKITDKNPKQSVVIAADKKVNYGKVITIMDLLKQNEVGKVGLLLTPAK